MKSKHKEKRLAEQEQLIRLVKERAENLFETGQLLCSEAVLTVLNRGLSGGMEDEAAIRVASTLPQGIGDSGCTCGALSGGALALGLFLGRDRPGGRDRHKAMNAANLLHDQFKELFGSTCCRVLSKKVKPVPKAHVEQCTRFTGIVAEMVARVIVERHPNLIEKADWNYLRKRESRVGAKLSSLLNMARN